MQRTSGLERLGRDQARAEREGGFDAAKLGYARDLAVAGQSAPQLVQRGSTGTQQGTVKQSESPVAEVARFGSSLAPISL